MESESRNVGMPVPKGKRFRTYLKGIVWKREGVLVRDVWHPPKERRRSGGRANMLCLNTRLRHQRNKRP